MHKFEWSKLCSTIDLFNYVNKRHETYCVAIENGIARSAVSNWKSNWANGIESLPSAANANALAAYFGVSVDYLLGNEEKKSPPPVRVTGLDSMILPTHCTMRPKS